MLADVNVESARQVAAELGDGAVAVEVDVRSSESVAAMVATADSASAPWTSSSTSGLSHKTGPITELTEDQYNLVMDVNVKGVWLGVKHAVPLLRRRAG